jgi:hypothetical protein
MKSRKDKCTYNITQCYSESFTRRGDGMKRAVSALSGGWSCSITGLWILFYNYAHVIKAIIKYLL